MMQNQAPPIKPVTGNRTLAAVTLKWTDNPGADLDATRNAGNFAAQTFTRLSNKQLNYNVTAYQVDVPYTHSSTNVPDAVKYAKTKIPTHDNYIMVNNNAPGEPYSYTEPGGDTSNLLDTLSVTFCHELGRQAPTILGSSGAVVDGKFEDQADGTTFMGHFSSDNLTASQLYYLGWLPSTQVQLLDVSELPATITITDLQADDTTNVKAVMITGALNKPLFLSRPTFAHTNTIMYALHIPGPAESSGPSNNKGSIREAAFAKTCTYAGLTFTQTATGTNNATIEVTKA